MNRRRHRWALLVAAGEQEGLRPISARVPQSWFRTDPLRRMRSIPGICPKVDTRESTNREAARRCGAGVRTSAANRRLRGRERDASARTLPGRVNAAIWLVTVVRRRPRGARRAGTRGVQRFPPRTSPSARATASPRSCGRRGCRRRQAPERRPTACHTVAAWILPSARAKHPRAFSHPVTANAPGSTPAQRTPSRSTPSRIQRQPSRMRQFIHRVPIISEDSPYFRAVLCTC